METKTMNNPAPNQLFRDLLDGKIPVPRRRTEITWPITLLEGQVEYISLVTGLPLDEARAFAEKMLAPPVLLLAPQQGRKISAATWMMARGASTLQAFSAPPPKQPETNPRKIALAAKEARGTGPRTSASWRGNERTTKYRNQ